MGVTLEEALSQVPLEPGRTYRCKVNGFRVEIRVQREIPPELLPAPLVESDVMLDAWVEFPPPKEAVIIRAKPGKLPLPDPPDIPVEDETL